MQKEVEENNFQSLVNLECYAFWLHGKQPQSVFQLLNKSCEGLVKLIRA